MLQGSPALRRPRHDRAVTRRNLTTVLALSAVLVMARRAEAQSWGDLAAWNALMVTPAGALPPRVHDALLAQPSRTELTFRYGRWRYDIDDAIHNDFGFTAAKRLGGGYTTVAVTAAYLSLSCGTCESWISGDVEVRRVLTRQRLTDDTVPDVTASFTLIGKAGSARYLGEGHAVAGSLAGNAAVAVSFPFFLSSRMSAAVLPGVGIGRLSSVDQDAYGTRPMLGASLAWLLPWGMVLDLGLQHVYIDGGPSQLGLALSWER